MGHTLPYFRQGHYSKFSKNMPFFIETNLLVLDDLLKSIGHTFFVFESSHGPRFSPRFLKKSRTENIIRHNIDPGEIQ